MDEGKDVTETKRSHPAQALLGLLSVQAVSAEWTQLELDPACPTVVTEGSGCGGWRPGSTLSLGSGLWQTLRRTDLATLTRRARHSQVAQRCSDRSPAQHMRDGGVGSGGPSSSGICLCWPSS